MSLTSLVLLLMAFGMLLSVPLIALAHRFRFVFKTATRAYYAFMYHVVLAAVVLGAIATLCGLAHLKGVC